MRYEHFKHKVVEGTTFVVCPKRAYNMDEGWDKEMDGMVGIPLLVHETTRDTAYLAAPKTGNIYAFGYRYLELLDDVKQVPIVLGEYKFLINETINPYVIREAALSVDKSILRKIKGIDLDSTNISIKAEQLADIQQKCPRIVGVLLCNNLMKRVN